MSSIEELRVTARQAARDFRYAENLSANYHYHRGSAEDPDVAYAAVLASQSKFECERCNAKHFTGDFDDVHVEGGDPDPVVFDEDEDGEEEE